MGKKKILIIDDEKDVVAELLLRLEAEGWEILAAYDGEEGLKKTRDQKPDLVLLDIVMPKLSGYQVCRKIKDDPEIKEIPVIMLTAKSDASTKFTAKDIGSEGYVTKPFDSEKLVEKINKLINKKG